MTSGVREKSKGLQNEYNSAQNQGEDRRHGRSTVKASFRKTEESQNKKFQKKAFIIGFAPNWVGAASYLTLVLARREILSSRTHWGEKRGEIHGCLPTRMRGKGGVLTSPNAPPRKVTCIEKKKSISQGPPTRTTSKTQGQTRKETISNLSQKKQKGVKKGSCLTEECRKPGIHGSW